MRAPGVPRVLANAFAVYHAPGTGWGIGMGPQFEGRQNANMQGTLYIPPQMELNGFIFYDTRNWNVRLNVKNILNARLVDPIDDFRPTNPASHPALLDRLA